MNSRHWAIPACIVMATASVAQAAPRLQTQVATTTVEVGQPFQVQVTCELEPGSESPAAPRLPVPDGVSVQGPSTSTQQSVSIVNGSMTRKSSVVLTWVVVASSAGRLRLGPASVIVDGKRYVDRPLEVTVVPPGSAPSVRRGNRRGMTIDPFDLMGGDPFSGPLLPGLPRLGNAPEPEIEEIPRHPAELDIEQAKDPTAFLDARATPKHVVLGEQIRLNVYGYAKPGVEPTNCQEPNLDGFLSYRSEQDDQLARSYAISVGDLRYFARKYLSYALFPTKTGNLVIGPTKMTLASRARLGQQGAVIERSSDPLTIVVDEPPLAGRPPSYHLGDVGEFSMNATVEPRQIQSGESVSVQIEIKGRGQLPQRLDPPEQAGVDWLEPSVSQQIDEQQGKIGGTRQFSYVVRLTREGQLDLGEMRFWYFDPSQRRYALAKAKLGTIRVSAGAASAVATGASTSSAEPSDELALSPRGKLSSVLPPTTPLADRPGFFLWLVFAPAATALLFAARSGIAKLRGLKSRWSQSTKVLIDAEFEQAKLALSRGELVQVCGHVERAVHLLIEARTGLRSRGLLREELPAALAASGLDLVHAQELVDLLERCDEQRFVQSSLDAAQELLKDGTHRVRAVLATPNRRGARS